MNTLTLTEAAELLKIHPQTLRNKVIDGEICGAKIGRAWVFLEEDLVSTIRTRYVDTGWSSKNHGDTTCYTDDKIAKYGGVDLVRRKENKYEELLKLQKGEKH